MTITKGIMLLLMIFALTFGTHLYFSINQNINDPVVSPLVPAIKDLIFTTSFAIFALSHREQSLISLLRTPPVYALAVFVASLLLIGLLKHGVRGVTTEMLPLLKNATMYLLGVFMIGLLLLRAYGQRLVVAYACIALSVAFALGFILFAFHPVKSLDGRLYGTFGNPTSLGFASLVLVGLSMWLAQQDRKTVVARETLAAVSLCGVMYILTGSLSVLVGFFLLIGVYAALEVLQQRSLASVWPALVLVVTFALVAACTGVALYLFGLPRFGFSRIIEFVEAPRSIATSDSIAVRLNDFAVEREGSAYHRYDSFLLSLWRHFGVFPVAAYLAWVALIMWRVFAVRGSEAHLMFALALVTLVFNPMIQHQTQTFPTNALFAIVAAIVWFGASRAEEATKKAATA